MVPLLRTEGGEEEPRVATCVFVIVGVLYSENAMRKARSEVTVYTRHQSSAEAREQKAIFGETFITELGEGRKRQ